MSHFNHSYSFSHTVLGCLGFFWLLDYLIDSSMRVLRKFFMSEAFTSVLSGAHSVLAGRGLGHLLCYSVKVTIPRVQSALWLYQLDRTKEHLLSFSSHNLLSPGWAHPDSQHRRTFSEEVHITYDSCTQQTLLGKLGFDSQGDPATAQVTEQRNRVHSFLYMVLFSWTHSRTGRWSNLHVGEWTILCWNSDHLLHLIWTKGFVWSIIKEL